MKNKPVLNMNSAGELLHQSYDNLTKAKYKPDHLFLRGFVSFLLMALCIGTDLVLFRSLFSMISYDSQIMILVQVAGLAFITDGVAAYAGILAKKINQKLSDHKKTLVLLVTVPMLGLIVNAVLRIATISLLSPDGSIDAGGIGLTFFAIVLPVLTSMGNFAISFVTYSPLAIKMCREEISLDTINGNYRRLQAIKDECDAFNSEALVEKDKQHLANEKKDLINLGFLLNTSVRVKLMQYLEDPATTNVLSKSRSDEICERLNHELKLLESVCNESLSSIKNKDSETTTVKKHTDGFSVA